MGCQLIFLGAPGSGKGTQASRLKSERGLQHLSTGDLLRREVSLGTDLGQEIKDLLDTGRLVDDFVMLKLLQANCDLSSFSHIFDGFPRTREQAKLLDEHVLLGKESLAIYFEIDVAQLFERLKNRLNCRDCGAIYSLKLKPPKQESVCDQCGGELLGRKDDERKVIETRLNIFSSTIGPILTYYEEDKRLRRVDASQDPAVVYEQLKGLL